jgi:hypothetical protein
MKMINGFKRPVKSRRIKSGKPKGSTLAKAA